jgi:chromosome segregation ATPase
MITQNRMSGFCRQQVEKLTDKLVWTKYNEFKTRQNDNEARLGAATEQLSTQQAQLDALVQPRT